MKPSYSLEYCLAWRHWVVPRGLQYTPVHRWYVFPHSFTREMVSSLIKSWDLSAEDHVLDPFVGAGTTILTAKELGVSATGYDLSPLSVFVTNAKTAKYNERSLNRAWASLKERMSRRCPKKPKPDYPQLVFRALPERTLAMFEAVQREIRELRCKRSEKDFFSLAVLFVLPLFSRAVATGGWLRWTDNNPDASEIPAAVGTRVDLMLADLKTNGKHSTAGCTWKAVKCDARTLPDKQPIYSAVVTSPPYPNRHDYTRVFGVELMFAFLTAKETKQVRYQSIHSHPEAHPTRPEASDYTPPKRLLSALAAIKAQDHDPRVPRMLKGYFLDMHLCLREINRVCLKGAKIALVVGNAQYYGHPVLVDELLADIGERVGLRCKTIVVARYRGNSAQQMGTFGRNPSRESVVVFVKT